MTGVGPVRPRQPRVRDRAGKGGERIRFQPEHPSALCPADADKLTHCRASLVAFGNKGMKPEAMS
jgi:hypothetical protein